MEIGRKLSSLLKMYFFTHKLIFPNLRKNWKMFLSFSYIYNYAGIFQLRGKKATFKKFGFILFFCPYTFVQVKWKVSNPSSSFGHLETILQGTLTMMALSAFHDFIRLLTTAWLPGWGKQGFASTSLKSFWRR